MRYVASALARDIYFFSAFLVFLEKSYLIAVARRHIRRH